MALEEPAYSVIASTGNYEVRRYEPYLVAEVDVDGNFGSAGNDAFRMLAGYMLRHARRATQTGTRMRS
jgi:hypothetical protein